MRNGSILLIDDDAIYVDTLSVFLVRQGYNVVTAQNVEEALRELEKTHIDLMIIDVRLETNDPRDHSGIEFASKISLTIPKIIMTSYPTHEAIRFSLRASDKSLPIAVDFIDKSEGPFKIVESINKAFDRFVVHNISQFKTGGALTSADAAIYTERDAERLVAERLRNNQYVLIIEPRQQGKTSLINFLRRTPLLENFLILSIDISSLNRASEEQWYRRMCFLLNRQLHDMVSKAPAHIAKDSFGWRDYLFEIAQIAKSHHKKILIAIDEVGAKGIPNAKDFFIVLRDIYNARDVETEFNETTFLLAGAFHPKNLINDQTISPFNIAQRVRLRDFNHSEIHHLSSPMLWSDSQRNEIVKQVFSWTKGQPYLTHKVLSLLRHNANKKNVDQVVGKLIREDGNHLPSIIQRIISSEEYKTIVKQILEGEKIWFSPSANNLIEELELIGIIAPDENGNCRIRNRIYETVLTKSKILE